MKKADPTVTKAWLIEHSSRFLAWTRLQQELRGNFEAMSQRDICDRIGIRKSTLTVMLSKTLNKCRIKLTELSDTKTDPTLARCVRRTRKR